RAPDRASGGGAGPRAAAALTSGSARGLQPLLTRLAALDSPERADQADERPAVGAGIAFRGPLLVAAIAAHHPVMLLELRFLPHRPPQRSSPYALILLISVAREMPSSWAARVRLPPWYLRILSMCSRSTSARLCGWWRRSLTAPRPPAAPAPPAAPPLPGSGGRCSRPIVAQPRASIIARSP